VIRLVKVTGVLWNGNHLGTSSASWATQDGRWSIWSHKGRWRARHQDGRSLAADSRSMLLDKIERYA
jgi:hypothetical protein